jgi:hypothetical protein
MPSSPTSAGPSGGVGEPVVASDQALLLATREDLDGLVQIDVWVGAEGPEEPAGQLAFDGELLTTGGGAVIGNSLGEQLPRIPLAIGWRLVSIFADPPGAPRRFTVLVDGADASIQEWPQG